MSDPSDDLLRTRLERLIAAIPVEARAAGSLPPPVVRRRSLRALFAAAAMLVVVSVAGTAVLIVLDQPESAAGAFGAGGLLHCSGVDQLTPRDAERWMTARGLDSRWQLEGAAGTIDQDTAPDRGFIVSALALDHRTLLVLVDLELDRPRDPRPCP